MAMMMARGSALSNAIANLLRWNFCRQDTKSPYETAHMTNAAPLAQHSPCFKSLLMQRAL
jgi:hypothetical protein